MLVAQLGAGEFLPQRRQAILLAGFGVSLLAFGVMASQRMIRTRDRDRAFTYFGVTVVVMSCQQWRRIRPMSWLAGQEEE